MSLLDSIRSLLGFEREERVPSGESRVTVERERGRAEPATAAENAVKGTDAEGADTDSPPEDGEATAVGRASAAATDASASTESLVDEDAGIEPAEAVAEADTDTGPAAEPAEATGPVADEPTTEPEDDTGAEATEPPAFEGPEADEPTDSITGIGASYAERLADAGVETVGELASAEPAALSATTGVSEKRLEGWIEQARDRLE